MYQQALPLMQHFFDGLGSIAVVAVFPYVRNMQESRAFQPNIDEGGLHARQHAFHTPDIDIADYSEMAAALNVELLHYSLLHYCNAGFLRGDID